MIRIRGAGMAWLLVAATLTTVFGPATGAGAEVLGANVEDPLAPPAAPGTDARFAVIGDFGSNLPAEADVADLVDGLAPDFVVTTGDNLYSSGGPGPVTFDNRVGQHYSDYIGDYTGAYGSGSSTNRFFPSPGNHDYTDIGATDDLAEYEAFFTLPGTGITTSDTSGSERYYDFLQGPVHFFVLDSQAILSSAVESTDEADWLQNGLAASTSPWQAVVLHHAPYSSSSAHGSNVDLQWPFATWGADAVFAGHDHTYERLTVDGIPYIVSGLGGKSIYGIGTTLPESEAHYTADYGTVIVDACADGMTMTFYSVSEGPVDTGQVGDGCALPSSPWTVTAPSGAISMSVELVSGSLRYTASRGGTLVVQSSDLGIQRTDTSFSSGLTLLSAPAAVVIDETYSAPHGKTSQLRNHASERTLEFSNTAGRRIQLIMRAYDDGVAFRYRFPESDAATFTVSDELTSFFIADNGRAVLQPRWPESLHDIVPTENPPGGVGGWVLPALFDLGHSWVMLAESDVDKSFYAAQIDVGAGNREYKIKVPDNNYGTTNPSWTLPWEMPWRVIMVGPDVDTVIGSDLVSHLADPSQIADTSWIVPGRVSWHWWSGAWVGNMSALEDYVDFAQAMGWEYSLIDADWDDHHTDQEMQDLVAYAAARDVGIILWYNSAGPQNDANLTPRDKMWADPDSSNPLYNPAIRQAEMAKLASWGVKGVKVDFFESEKQIMVQQYLGILKDAAAEEIMVLFHGSTTPRGWYRTWPNMMTTEAVRGAEYYRGPQSASFPSDAPLHNVEVAFTRNVVGPMDYTPVTFSDNTVGQTVVHQTTNAHELALSVVYESGLVHLADSIASYQAQPLEVQDFLKDVPAAWDEIRFLEGDPSSHIVLARRKGNDWYLGGINGTGSSRPVSIDLTQFGYGGSGGTLIADGATDRTFATSAITGTTLNVTMAARGGFVAELPGISSPADFTIMPVGDSVTEGNDTWHTYRCYLWDDLSRSPYSVDFVGSLAGTYHTATSTHTGSSGCPWSFDEEHEAYWGERADEVGPKAVTAATALQPDIVLVHLGTNDVLQGQPNSQTKDEARDLITGLRAANSNVALLLARPIPCDPTAGNPEFGTKCSVDIPDLGDRLYELAWEEDTPQSPVIVIDQHTNLLLTDLRDGVHPDDGGDDKMADAWLAGLEPVLDGIDPAGDVSVTGMAGTTVTWSPTHSFVDQRPLSCAVVAGSGNGAVRAGLTSCISGSFESTGLTPGQYTFRYSATDSGSTANGSATHFGEVTVAVLPTAAPVGAVSVSIGGVDHVGVLVEGSARVLVRRTSDGVVVSEVDFGNLIPVDVEVLADTGDVGSDPELVVLGVNPAGLVQVVVKDSVSGAQVGSANFGTQFTGDLDLEIVGSDVGVLGTRAADGLVRVQVRDLSNSVVGTVTFGKRFSGVDFEVVGSDVAVVGTRLVAPNIGAVRVQTRTLSNTVVKQVNYGLTYTGVDLEVFGADLGVLGVRADGVVRTQLRSSTVGSVSANVFFGPTYTAADLENLAGNVAVMGVRAADQMVRTQVRSVAGALVGNMFYGPVYTGVDLEAVGADAGVLGVKADGTIRVQIRDTTNTTTANLLYN